MTEDRAATTGRSAETVFFTKTYDETVALIEEARAYLRNIGPHESLATDLDSRFAYTVETLRMTTRLAEALAWLLYRRAYLVGEIDREHLASGECALDHKEVCLGVADVEWDSLPYNLQSLLYRSESLYRRVMRLEETARNARSH